MVQVRTNPVNDRHKVVAHSFDARLAEVGKALYIVCYQPVSVRACILDCLTYRQTFHHRPAKSGRFYILFHFLDSFQGPDFTVRYIVQSSNNPFYSYLTQHGKCNLIFLAKPSPCFFHPLYAILKWINRYLIQYDTFIKSLYHKFV